MHEEVKCSFSAYFFILGKATKVVIAAFGAAAPHALAIYVVAKGMCRTTGSGFD